MVWQLGDIMHDEQDFLAAHGCKTPEEYDRKRFFEWVDAMEEQFIQTNRLVIPKPRHDGIIIQPIDDRPRQTPHIPVTRSTYHAEQKRSSN
jgi:hypothetical protein